MKKYEFKATGEVNGKKEEWKVVFNGVDQQDAERRMAATLKRTGVNFESLEPVSK